MKLPTISPGLAGKTVKYRPLSEPIRLQNLEDSARLQAWKKKVTYVLKVINCYFAPFSRLNLTLHIPDTFLFLHIWHQFMLIFFAFDNDDIESSKRRVTFLSLIFLLN